MSIVEFLTARLDEREEAAKRLQQWASDGDWDTGGDFEVCLIEGVLGPFGGQTSRRAVGVGVDLAAIADPMHVLAEVKAKRVLLKSCSSIVTGPDVFIRDGNLVYLAVQAMHVMACAYADHPDYNPNWTLA